MRFPDVQNDDDIDRLREKPETCLEILRTVAEHASISAREIEFFDDGSNLVGGAGEVVIKLFAPFDEPFGSTERAALEFLQGRLPVPTPAVRAQGEIQGWSYLIMSRISGQPLSSVWDRLSSDDRVRLCRGIGETAAALHALDSAPVAHLEPNWNSFIAGQRRHAVARQVESGLASEWTSQIESFLESVPLPSRQPALLHTELAREHFFVSDGTGRWELSGLLDFEPAMVGQPEYEFASVGLFVSRGDSALLRACFQGYGYGDDQLDSELARRCLAYTLLHRYSRLTWYFEFMPIEGLQSLDELAQAWWPVANPS